MYLTVDETIEKLREYPGHYVVVISHHKGEGALVALSPEVYQESKARPLYHVMPDRREKPRDGETSDGDGPAGSG